MLASSSVSSSTCVIILNNNTEFITSVLSDCIDSKSSDSTRENCELEKVRSSVCKHFGFPAQGGKFKEKGKKKWTTVYCKLCPRKLHYQGSTINMMVHLEYSNHAKFLKIETTQGNVATNSKTKDSDQPMIKDSFEKAQPLSESSMMWRTQHQFAIASPNI